MKLDYKILWLDDQIHTINDDGYTTDIFQFLSEQGFEAKIDLAKTEVEFFNFLDKDDSYDLILTDYHLDETSKNTRNGDEIIGLVRDRSIFTEIMFYSAQEAVADTIKKDRITFFDTRRVVGNGHFEKIVEKAISLIALTIKKFQHIVAMRGMIMNETSSLDVEMMEVLLKIINQKGAENVIPTIKEKYKETNLQFNEYIETTDEVSIILQKIGSEHRWRAIVRNIEKGEIKTIFDNYKKDIIDERNRFAHAVLEEDEQGRKYFRYKENGIDFNEEKCKEIRINISKHKQNIIDLKRKLP